MPSWNSVGDLRYIDLDEKVDPWWEEIAFRQDMLAKLEKDFKRAFMATSGDLPVKKIDLATGNVDMVQVKKDWAETFSNLYSPMVSLIGRQYEGKDAKEG